MLATMFRTAACSSLTPIEATEGISGVAVEGAAIGNCVYASSTQSYGSLINDRLRIHVAVTVTSGSTCLALIHMPTTQRRDWPSKLLSRNFDIAIQLLETRPPQREFLSVDRCIHARSLEMPSSHRIRSNHLAEQPTCNVLASLTPIHQGWPS